MAILAVLLVGHGLAIAASNTGPLSSSVTVTQNCNITVANMSFPNYDPLATGATTTTANISVACTKGTTGANIGLDNGQNHTHATAGQNRAMANGANYLSYDIFQDASHATFWGNTPGTNTEAVPRPTSKAAQNFTAYGQIPARQNVRIGTYTDTVLATVNF